MRETPRRSLARLAVLASALVAIGACAPHQDPLNRPGPCVDDQVLCQATGYCMSPTDVVNPALCAPGYSVRQGATIYIPIPVATVEEVTKAETASDLDVGRPNQQADGSIVVPVSAAHGLASGDGDSGPNHRIVTIETRTDGEPVTRNVLVVVSHITAALMGDNSNPGTSTSPYATFKQALSVAEKGDTIELVDFTKAPDDSTAVQCSATADSTISIPDGVTVIGRDSAPTKLTMNVVLYGDAVLDNIQLTGARLVMQMPGSNVTLRNVNAKCGVDVSIAASIDPAAASTDPSGSVRRTTLLITGSGSQIWNDLSFESPLQVQAFSASVTIEDNAEVLLTTPVASPTMMPTMTPTPPVETIRFDGDAGDLSIRTGAHIGGSRDSPAIQLLRSTKVFVADAFIEGPLLVNDPGSSVEITSSVLQTLPGVTAIVFNGHDMKVTDTQFMGDGIEQNGGAVTVDGMSVRSFNSFAYKLAKGTATISNSDFSHFGGPVVSSAGPWALWVDAPSDSLSMLTSSTTKFDVEAPVPPCAIPGPADLPGVYSITNRDVSIGFR